MSALSHDAVFRLNNAVRAAFNDSGLMCDGSLHAEVMRATEAQLLRLALEYHQGNQLRAARTLGLNRNTVLKLMRGYGIGRSS